MLYNATNIENIFDKKKTPRAFLSKKSKYYTVKLPGYKGNIIMTDEWFNEYMFRLVVEKKYVPADVLSLLQQKPVMLPSWDPMFSMEE